MPRGRIAEVATNGDASPSLREVRWHLEAQLVPVRSVEKKDQKNNKTNEDFSPKDRQRDFVKCPLRSPVHQGCLADLEVLVLLEVPLCREGGKKKKSKLSFPRKTPIKSSNQTTLANGKTTTNPSKVVLSSRRFATYDVAFGSRVAVRSGDTLRDAT